MPLPNTRSSIICIGRSVYGGGTPRYAVKMCVKTERHLSHELPCVTTIFKCRDQIINELNSSVADALRASTALRRCRVIAVPGETAACEASADFAARRIKTRSHIDVHAQIHASNVNVPRFRLPQTQRMSCTAHSFFIRARNLLGCIVSLYCEILCVYNF